jgi:hypothetical protein
MCSLARRHGTILRIGAAIVALLAPSAARAETEWQIRPFVGLTFKGSTTLVDPELAVGKTHLMLGASVALLWDIVGVEGELGHAPGFFQSGDQDLVTSSRLTTLTGNVIIGFPRRATEYSLRPYFVGGFGLLDARSLIDINALEVNMTSTVMNLGGGVSGSLSDRTGLSWELRHFRSLGGDASVGGSLAPVQLSFWRANMALVIRY